jgi:hypothetical protein
MPLAQLITDPAAGIADIATFLDSLDASARWAEVNRLDRAQQRTLFGRADPGGLDLNDLVLGAAPAVAVIHDGLNTLPVPPPLRRFSKRFCRPGTGDTNHLYGYNEGPTRRLLGPGYFLARLAEADDPNHDLGSVMVDYARVPSGAVAAGWPPVVPNTTGLQRFVYHRTSDYLRRVSQHVSVGAAVKDGKPLDHYFVLCRRP